MLKISSAQATDLARILKLYRMGRLDCPVTLDQREPYAPLIVTIDHADGAVSHTLHDRVSA